MSDCMSDCKAAKALKEISLVLEEIDSTDEIYFLVGRIEGIVKCFFDER